MGANEIWAAVPPERCEQAVRKFAAFTRDLMELVKWFLDCGIRSVAMEATGVYWIPLFQLLEENGIKVCLVNARHVKNAPGRKSDVRDCQWLQYLHSVGLLVGSFRPAQAICATRSIYRFRQNLLTTAGQFVQHAQAALDQMNIKLHHVIDDITGVTGQAIIEAILSGQRESGVTFLLIPEGSSLLNSKFDILRCEATKFTGALPPSYHRLRHEIGETGPYSRAVRPLSLFSRFFPLRP